MPAEILGPTGLLLAALIAVGVLWRSHMQQDAETRADLAYWRDLAMKGTELADKATTVAVRKR